MIWQFVLLCAGMALVIYAVSGLLAHSGVLSDQVTLRSNHVRPVSRAGGLLIAAVVSVTLLALSTTGRIPPMPPFVMAILLMAIIGAMDDVRSQSAVLKLVLLVVIAALVPLMTGSMAAIPVPFSGMFDLPSYLAWPLSVVFILGFVNAFNFMDGLNGMAAGAGIVGCGLLVAIGAGGSGGMVLAAVVLSAALFGFAIRNIGQGNIFLGDSGSLGVGAFLAVNAIHIGHFDPMGFYAIVIAFLPFLADTIITFARRLVAKKQVLEPHNEHFYQRLRAAGWSHQAVALVYTGVMLVGAIFAHSAWRYGGATSVWGAAAATLLIYAGVMVWMFRSAAKRS